MSSSMRYIRGSGGNSQDNRSIPGRGGLRTASTGGRSSWTRGRGRGRGRGGGVDAGRISGRGRFSHSFVRGTSAKIHGSAARPNDFPLNNTIPDLPGNKWVRDSGKSDGKAELSVPKLNNEKRLTNEISQAKTTAPATSAATSEVAKKAETRPNCLLERRGKHKLVVKRDTSQVAAALTDVDSIEAKVPTECRKIYTVARAKYFHSGNNAWKRSSAKPFGDSNPNEGNNTMAISNENQNIDTRIDCVEKAEKETGRSSHNEMQPRGFGKVVLKSADVKQINPDAIREEFFFSGSERRTWNRQSSDFCKDSAGDGHKGDKVHHTWSAASHCKRKRADLSSAPRRISLPKLKDTADGSETTLIGGGNYVDANKESSSDLNLTPAEKTLTDFCYKNTGRGGGRGRGKGRASVCRQAAGGSMGLVRVKPHDPSSTPICPTFRRGLPCNNPKCTLRHDVSTEASRPICVFFQRNGMCSKGNDCPFLHVKVRWDAEICPMFAKVGYCEDSNCLLKHVLAKKKHVQL